MYLRWTGTEIMAYFDGGLMIQVCCECKVVYGEKEPLEDKSETHGFCEPCFTEWKRKYQMSKLEGGE